MTTKHETAELPLLDPLHPPKACESDLRQLQFVRVERNANACIYYCAAPDIQSLTHEQAQRVARALGPHVAALRDDDGDWVFGIALDVLEFTAYAHELATAAQRGRS